MDRSGFHTLVYEETVRMPRRRRIGHEHEFAPCEVCYWDMIRRARFNVVMEERKTDPAFVAPCPLADHLVAWEVTV